MTLLGLPWTAKVLWAPLVDRYGDRRTWMTACLAAMAVLAASIPLFDPGSPSMFLWALLFAFTLASATQDIAIDAYTIGLLDHGEEGAANGVRVTAYRLALVASGGGLLILAGQVGWAPTFWLAGALLAGLAVMAHRSPRLAIAAPATSAEWWGPLRHWLARPGAAAVFLFVLTYKLGDASMGPMVKPFWVERGLSLEEIGAVSTTFGVFATVAGAAAGGALTSRWGIFTALWVLGLAQAFSNLGYAAAAFADWGRPGIYSASMIESFTGGLGTAAFLAYLMNICDKTQAATEYALLSALFALPRFATGAVSGWATTQIGFGNWFLLTFFLSFPAYALLPWARRWIQEDPR
jgi:PAT family beta-lactamase induction signal transducer AmpG